MACPICKRDSVQQYRPFCSRRCADVDLGNWMTGAYVVPGADPADPEKMAQELEKVQDNQDGDTPDHLH